MSRVNLPSAATNSYILVRDAAGKGLPTPEQSPAPEPRYGCRHGSAGCYSQPRSSARRTASWRLRLPVLAIAAER
jgi:hypothetical protein